jgi:hypothetical protein
MSPETKSTPGGAMPAGAKTMLDESGSWEKKGLLAFRQAGWKKSFVRLR